MSLPTADIRQVAGAATAPAFIGEKRARGGVFGELYFLNLVGPLSLALASASALASAAPGLRPFLAPFCHQIEARTFCPDGRPMGLCARCTGVYLGVAAAWAGLAWLKRRPGVLEPACYALAALSVLLWLAGVEVGNWPRFALGLSLGAAGAFAL
jgi:hypothetical protein